MIKIAICDDELPFTEQLKNYISDFLEHKQFDYEIDIFYSGKQLLDMGKQLGSYTILFLDIEMNGIDGIQTAVKIREFNDEIFIVFVTAFIDYSLEGYKVNAIRYILKNENMKAAIKESLKTILKKVNYVWRKEYFSFVEEKRNVSLKKIIYVESNLHKVLFYILQGKEIEKYTLYSTLNKIENQLNSGEFLRIHQSFLINMQYIKKYGRYEVILKGNIKLPIPKKKYNDIEKAIVMYKGEL